MCRFVHYPHFWTLGLFFLCEPFINIYLICVAGGFRSAFAVLWAKQCLQWVNGKTELLMVQLYRIAATDLNARASNACWGIRR